MLSARSTFETAKASQYLQQLCKHFAHKVEVKFDATRGEVAFACGKAELQAEDGVLHFLVRAEDLDGLEQTKSALESHIIRFAFRENLLQLDWQ